jgi:hypothetical protein
LGLGLGLSLSLSLSLSLGLSLSLSLSLSLGVGVCLGLGLGVSCCEMLRDVDAPGAGPALYQSAGRSKLMGVLHLRLCEGLCRRLAVGRAARARHTLSSSSHCRLPRLLLLQECGLMVLVTEAWYPGPSHPPRDAYSPRIEHIAVHLHGLHFLLQAALPFPFETTKITWRREL